MNTSALLRSTEFLVVDTETNGLGGDRCELTEVGAVLVGGGELHDRWETLVAVRTPLSRGIQRFTGITQTMVDEAPPAEVSLPELAALAQERVLVAHNASFDRRVLAQAFDRSGVPWPAPPVLCTVALARRFAPLVRQRKLAPLAASLGIEVEVTHRALADAETCARVFCALFPRLCAHAETVADALALLGPARPSRSRRPRAGATDGPPGGRSLAGVRRRRPELGHVPDAPGVYVFRNAAGQPLYVGKSVALRSRVRAHFSPSSPDGPWVAQAETVDHVETASELGALLLEQQLIRGLRPPGNTRGKHADPYVYVRARLDIAFPVLEVADAPAAGRAVNIGPLRGRRGALELVEQLNSLFGLRHCGRGLPRRSWPSAYGQMGRCLSPCLGDLDPNLYRRRLDAALATFSLPRRAGVHPLLRHLDQQMHEAGAAGGYERAAWLRRRRERLAALLERLGGTVAALHARPQIAFAPGRTPDRWDAVWLVGGRIADFGGGPPHALAERSRRALARCDAGGPPALTPEQAIDARIATTWIEANLAPVLPLRPEPTVARIERFLVKEQLEVCVGLRRDEHQLGALMGEIAAKPMHNRRAAGPHADHAQEVLPI